LKDNVSRESRDKLERLIYETRMSRNHLSEALGSLTGEIIVRVVLLCSFLVTEELQPFHRVIHKEEFWLLDNPRTPSYYPTWMLISSASVVPFVTIYILSFCRGDKEGAVKAWLAFSFSGLFTGFVTNVVKNVVGRPRPDFMNRCFPDGIPESPFADDGRTLLCIGDPDVIKEGRKSFPSGHSSIMFSSIGFLSFYLAQKLHVCGASRRSEAWRLVVSLLPFFFCLLVALSRTCDYHHHWQDVTVGSTLGFLVAYASFRLYLCDTTQVPKNHLPYSSQYRGRKTSCNDESLCVNCRMTLNLDESCHKDGALVNV